MSSESGSSIQAWATMAFLAYLWLPAPRPRSFLLHLADRPHSASIVHSRDDALSAELYCKVIRQEVCATDCSKLSPLIGVPSPLVSHGYADRPLGPKGDGARQQWAAGRKVQGVSCAGDLQKGRSA